jgi:hypothetical protein
VLAYGRSFGNAEDFLHKHKHKFVFVQHKHKKSFGIAPLLYVHTFLDILVHSGWYLFTT